jgi:hypothetical protein
VPSTTPPEPTDTTGKGRPTPSRKQQEAARKRPLVPADRKAASKQDRAAARAQRDREYEAMKNGDERYLPVRDKGPERRWIRDYVDARHSVGEWFLPVSVLGIVAVLFSGQNVYIYLGVLIALYLGVIVSVVDAVILGRRLKRGLEAKFGASRLPRGYRMYGITRAFQLRRLRLPKPMVTRGQFPS